MVIFKYSGFLLKIMTYILLLFKSEQNEYKIGIIIFGLFQDISTSEITYFPQTSPTFLSHFI